MTSLQKQYSRELSAVIGGGYHGLWRPDQVIKIGDLVKSLPNGQLQVVGNIGELTQYRCEIRTQEAGSEWDYASKGSVDVTFATQAGAVTDIRVAFSREWALLIQASGCVTTTLVTRNLEAVLRSGWRKRWFTPSAMAVVTELVQAERATILLSEAKDAEIRLSASGPVTGSVPLARIDTRIGLVSKKGIGDHWVGLSGVTPWFKARTLAKQHVMPDAVYQIISLHDETRIPKSHWKWRLSDWNPEQQWEDE